VAEKFGMKVDSHYPNQFSDKLIEVMAPTIGKADKFNVTVNNLNENELEQVVSLLRSGFKKVDSVTE